MVGLPSAAFFWIWKEMQIKISEFSVRMARSNELPTWTQVSRKRNPTHFDCFEIIETQIHFWRTAKTTMLPSKCGKRSNMLGITRYLPSKCRFGCPHRPKCTSNTFFAGFLFFFPCENQENQIFIWKIHVVWFRRFRANKQWLGVCVCVCEVNISTKIWQCGKFERGEWMRHWQLFSRTRRFHFGIVDFSDFYTKEILFKTAFPHLV